MDQRPKDSSGKVRARNKKLAPFGILFALLGLLLFAYTVKKAGVSEIIGGLRRLGVGFLVIIALSAIRQVARSLAWIKCLEAPYRLRFRDALAARDANRPTRIGRAAARANQRQPAFRRRNH